MSSLRPEIRGTFFSMDEPREEVLRKLYKSVARRRTLTRGKLHEGNQHCALGCLENDCKAGGVHITLSAELADEIAAVNDKLGPDASPKRRWQHVMRWLRKEIAKCEAKAS